MIRLISPFVLGGLFGLGLLLSGMTDTARVQGFLDISGVWDPTLAFVMGGALLITLPGFFWLRRRDRSLQGEPCQWPHNRSIDWRLLLGAALFGVGWGMVGLCPGPMLAGLAQGHSQTLWVLLGTLSGLWLSQRLPRR